jgi:hypothetical protein
MVHDDGPAAGGSPPDRADGVIARLPARVPGAADLSEFAPAGQAAPPTEPCRQTRLRPWARGAASVAAAVLVAGCSGAAVRDAAPVEGGSGSGQLGGVCPRTVVVQTSWYPESTHGGLVQLLMGGKYTVDRAHKLVRGPLIDQGQDTGVQLELRAGGPAVDQTPVSALMATDRSIVLGQQATDEQVLGWASGQPTVAVMVPFQVDPVVMIWDSRQHPDWNTVSDIGQTNQTVFTFDNAITDFLKGSGVLRPGQINTSYDGSPTAFMTHPDAAVGGFSTNEPFIYRSLGRHVAYAYVTNDNYPNNRNTVTVRRADLGRLGPCLARLVPIMQRGMVEFMAHPDPALQAIVALDQAYQSPFPYPIAQARYGVKVMRDDGLVGNGPGGWVGGMATERFQKMIDALRPIYASTKFGKPVPADVTPEALADPGYLDPTIRMPA